MAYGTTCFFSNQNVPPFVFLDVISEEKCIASQEGHPFWIFTSMRPFFDRKILTTSAF